MIYTALKMLALRVPRLVDPDVSHIATQSPVVLVKFKGPSSKTKHVNVKLFQPFSYQTLNPEHPNPQS
jgi:hypothetical protein